MPASTDHATPVLGDGPWAAGLLSSSLFRYLVVGGIGYVVCLATFAASIHLLGIDEYASIIPAFVANTVSNFVLNRWWTFSGVADRSAAGDARRYAVVALVALVVNYATFHLFFSVMGLPDVPAQAVAIIIGIPVGFVGSRYWAFAARTDRT